MCRQIAYLGPPLTLESLVLAPEHSLLHQSYRPRHQRHGVVNADGFGCGWFRPDVRPEPAVYRRDKPIWSDRTFSSIAGVISTGAFLAAVRDATTGAATEESSTAPFTAAGWLFAHNGLFRGFDGPLGVTLRKKLSDHRLGFISGTSDSEVIFGLILDRLEEGATPGQALGWAVSTCLQLTTGAFNFVLMDSAGIYATACGDSLYVCEDGKAIPHGVVVASEPFDEDPAWTPVPDSSAVQVTGGEVAITSLKEGG